MCHPKHVDIHRSVDANVPDKKNILKNDRQTNKHAKRPLFKLFKWSKVSSPPSGLDWLECNRSATKKKMQTGTSKHTDKQALRQKESNNQPQNVPIPCQNDQETTSNHINLNVICIMHWYIRFLDVLDITSRFKGAVVKTWCRRL